VADDAVGVGIEASDEHVQTLLVIGDSGFSAEPGRRSFTRLGLEELVDYWSGTPDRIGVSPVEGWRLDSARGPNGGGSWGWRRLGRLDCKFL
jgi:hypothetical protein